MNDTSDKTILLRAKYLIKHGGNVPLLWLITDEFKLRKDVNHAELLACRLTKGMRYERFVGHNPDDIFIKQRSDYYYKLIGLVVLIAGCLSGIVGLLVSLSK